MEFARQEYWSRFPFSSPGNLPHPGVEPGFPALQADSLLSELPGKPSVQFSLVAQSCLTLCDPMDYSMPGSPVHHQLPELAQTHVVPFSFCLQSFPASAYFLLSHFFASGGQSIVVFQLQHQSFLLMALEATKYPTGSEK